MIFGTTLLAMAGLISVTNYLSDILPPVPCDPPGIFDRPFDKYYDHIVVGAGSAGTVVASRLSENPCSVLLLEAGDSDINDDLTQIPLMFGSQSGGKNDWGYLSVPQTCALRALKDESSYIARGKVLGGTDSMSALNYIRGSRFVYDEWEKEGVTGWGFNDVLPYFKKMENVQIPELRKSGYFGTNGPLNIEAAGATKLEFFHKMAMKELGVPCNPSCNGPDQIGFCPMQIMVKDGKRCNGMTCYIRPILHRNNLQVNTNSHVTKVLISNGVAHGVEVYKNNVTYEIYARKEIIISAGVIGSPQILLLSGVGPKPHLESLRIPVHANLPVGENLQDKMRMILQYATNVSLNINMESIRDEKNVLDYVLHREGIFRTNGGDGNIFMKFINQYTKQKLPDVQVVLAGFAYEKLQIISVNSNLKPEVAKELLKRMVPRGFVVLLWLLNPKSKGFLKLASTNPFEYPIIQPNFLTNPTDVETFVRSIRFTRKLEKTNAWRSINAKLVRHDLQGHCDELFFNTDAYWNCMVRHFAIQGAHFGSTCRIGNIKDPTAVVDPYLRFKGIRNLRVADASVFRNTPSGLTSGPAMMVGERAADFIKQYNKINTESIIVNGVNYK